jgi:hypothetical protein
MRPLAHHRDIVFVGPSRKDIEALLGLECAIVLEDGRRFFKVIENGSKKGFYDLLSYNAEPIRDSETCVRRNGDDSGDVGAVED